MRTRYQPSRHAEKLSKDLELEAPSNTYTVFDMLSSTEPGGYIQRDEFNSIVNRIIVLPRAISTTSVKRLIKYVGNNDRYQ